MVTGFPDWRFEPGPLRHGDDFVFVELRMTGRQKDVQVACVFEFAADKRQLGKL